MDKYEYDGHDMSKLTILDGTKYSFNQPPNNIIFYDTSKGYQREVLRITKDGIIGNPDVPTDEAADAVIRVLDGHIKSLTKRTWVGLTKDDIAKLLSTHHMYMEDFVKGVEALLKEKNGYNT